MTFKGQAPKHKFSKEKGMANKDLLTPDSHEASEEHGRIVVKDICKTCITATDVEVPVGAVTITERTHDKLSRSFLITDFFTAITKW